MIPIQFNYKLLCELTEIPYPMWNYKKFAISWPYTAERIKQYHEWVRLSAGQRIPYDSTN